MAMDTASQKTQSLKLSKKECFSRLLEMLSNLAAARQANPSDLVLKLYATTLSGYDLRDIELACGKLMLQPREAFKSAFPEVGEIIRETLQFRDARVKPDRGKFAPCERSVFGGSAAGFKGEYRGAECINGMWAFWQQVYTDSGEPMYQKPSRQMTICDCKLAYLGITRQQWWDKQSE